MKKQELYDLQSQYPSSSWAIWSEEFSDDGWVAAGQQVWGRHLETNNAGNGSVMWCAPLAIAYAGDPDLLTKISRHSSQTTHADPPCTYGCAILNLTNAVQDGSLELTTQPSHEPVPDGGFESPEAVREILADGYVFELTHREDETVKTHLVTHVEPDRPSMTPLKGPPTYWFETLGSGERFPVRLPELEALHPVSYEQLANPLSETAVAAVREKIADNSATLQLETIQTMLRDAASEATDIDAEEALRLALTTLQHRDDARARVLDPTFTLLEETETSVGREVLQTIAKVRTDDPTILASYVPELVGFASQESLYQRPATRCLMELAEANPDVVVNAVPVLESVAATADETTRSYVVYALSHVAETYPEEVVPAIDVLIEAIQTEDETTQTNALSALGKITSNYPDAAEPIVEKVVGLLTADAKRIRNNAVGLLGDIAQEHPELVIEYADAIAARLEDNNIQARINASIALLRAGKANPNAIREQQAHLETALTDASPEVRANVCVLIGNANVPIPVTTLRDLEENDLDETVRERAAWAITRLT